MTESFVEVDADFPDDAAEEDPRIQLRESLAATLASLSEAVDTPIGFSQPASLFDAGDVSFDGGSWVSRLAEVQGWLHFDGDLPTTSIVSFMAALAAELGLATVDVSDANGNLTVVALERLAERAELAYRLQQAFAQDLADGASRASATDTWAEAWADEDGSAGAVSPEPVTAKAEVFPISQLTGMKLNLTPSYQRGDVWRTGDRQALVESILRGIPLPSVILLRTGPSTPHDVVDGKQRLTAILRFVGKHPVAVERVKDADRRHPSANLKGLFNTDYPRFRRAWKQVMGEPLTAKLEDEYYFPFKLRADGKGGLIGEHLEQLRGKYFTQIVDNVIEVADEEVSVQSLFGEVVSYKVPVIVYTRASQRQIHEVFKLYNKQGMHLNAEEIRNAIYHEVELTRATLVAAGDADPRSDLPAIAPSIAGIDGVRSLGDTLKGYGFGDARYRRTKVLAWVLSVLLNDTQDKSDGTFKDLASTARHIDQLLGQVQEWPPDPPRDPGHPLNDHAKLGDLFSWISQAADLHAAHDELWAEKFKDGDKGGKWQELQLVGTLAGMAIALAGAPDDIEERIAGAADDIRAATQTPAWTRPLKTQTRTQWDYIARLAKGVPELLGTDIAAASENIRARFGSSGVESLLRMISTPAD
jgi:hypothetical protein